MSAAERVRRAGLRVRRRLVELLEIEVLILEHVRELVRQRHARLDRERTGAADQDLLRLEGRTSAITSAGLRVVDRLAEVDVAADESRRPEHGGRLLDLFLLVLQLVRGSPSLPSRSRRRDRYSTFTGWSKESPRSCATRAAIGATCASHSFG